MEIRRQDPSPIVEAGYLRFKVQVPGAEPRHILEKIVWHKEIEVAKLRDRTPLVELKKQLASTPPPLDFFAALGHGKTQPALIAEVKKASPSKGLIRADFDPVAIARAYEAAGASCISVLTDSEFFQGSFENLAIVRKTVKIPLLCKEFILYPYQIYLARTQGADAVLLIAAILKDQDLAYFVKISHSLGMTPLIEVHSLDELDRVLALKDVKLVGINNRNLEDFSVDLATTAKLMQARSSLLAAKGILVVSESGLHTPEDLNFVEAAGAKAVLIGESLLVKPDPGETIRNLFAKSSPNH